ncbi:MAG: NAD+ synthase [Candidatus Nanohaloarchaea archaeon]|jgi:NAD+ synthase
MDYEKVADKVHRFLQNKLEETGAEGYVIGVSGGLDSAVGAKMAVDAVGSENVYGWVMPGDPSNSENMKDARQLCDKLDLNYREVDIEKVVEDFTGTAPISTGGVTEGNIRARVRMIYEYMDANKNDLLVLGAGNKTEIKTGYFTKHGDGAVDVRPLADLYKTEVKELAKHIGLGQNFIEKQPTAGLWEGQTDEGELGATYSKIDTIMEHILETDLDIERISDKIGIEESEVERFKQMYEKSRHKRQQPPSPSLR